MREILFRGFTPDENGREVITVEGKQIRGLWVQGSYWEPRETTYCFNSDYDSHPDNTKHYIVFDQMTDWGLPNRHLQADVLPETVGQYTGLKDKNGKKIFEGDIVKHYNEASNPERFEVGMVWWDDRHLCFKRTSNPQSVYVWGNCKYEVIGNIHDNPELLGGADND